MKPRFLIDAHGRFALPLAWFAISSLGAEQFSLSMPAWVSSVSFSPDSKQLAVGCADSSVHLLEGATGKEIAALRGHEDYVASVAFSPDGKSLATGSYDHTARIWDLKRALHVLRGHGDVVSSVSYSPDAQWLATGSIDGTVKLWNAATGKLRTTLS